MGDTLDDSFVVESIDGDDDGDYLVEEEDDRSDENHSSDDNESEEGNKKKNEIKQAKLLKKKRKFKEFKDKKKQANSIECEVAADAKKTKHGLNPDEQLELFLLHQPPLMTLSFKAEHFIESKLSTNSKKCSFSNAIISGIEGYKKAFNKSTDDFGFPIVLVICAGAKRAADVINSISKDMKVKVAKLFAKHFKVQEQMDLLSRNHFPIAVGTPNRINKLIELGALKLSKLQLVLIDIAQDSKSFTTLSLTDTRNDLYNMMQLYIENELSHLKLSLIDQNIVI
jgi:hypothetical protein